MQICLKIDRLYVSSRHRNHTMIEDTVSIKVERTANSRLSEVDWDNLPFGKVFSDHILEMEYKDGAWQTPEIRPFHSLNLHPATSALHYGQSIFEGMKAYKGETGEVLLFRPDMNAKRFMESCERMCMPIVPEDKFLELVKKIVDVDRDWDPNKDAYAFYVCN